MQEIDKLAKIIAACLLAALVLATLATNGINRQRKCAERSGVLVDGHCIDKSVIIKL
jgi:hypothetical protein